MRLPELRPTLISVAAPLLPARLLRTSWVGASTGGTCGQPHQRTGCRPPHL